MLLPGTVNVPKKASTIKASLITLAGEVGSSAMPKETASVTSLDTSSWFTYLRTDSGTGIAGTVTRTDGTPSVSVAALKNPMRHLNAKGVRPSEGADSS